MTQSDTAQKVLDALKLAQRAPAQEALPILNGLAGLVQGGSEQQMEVEDARASAFLAICEVGKALHRGQPAAGLYTTAIDAAERWMRLVTRPSS
jgi:hypothetical protein